MARTYKDDPKYRGRKERRSERGEYRGRRWNNEDGGRSSENFRIPRGLELRNFRADGERYDC